MEKSSFSNTGIGLTKIHKGYRFAVWAPHADAVFVTGSFNKWSKKKHPMEKDDAGVWIADVAEAHPGDEYRYRILNGEQELMRIDPWAHQVTSSVGNAIVSSLERRKNVHPFTPPKLNELVIYEMHIGTFGKQPGDPGPGDLEGAMKRLEYLRDLGINAVEVMPLAEFAGGYSWGYNPSQMFAVESDYGTPHSFHDFVEEAHRLGLAVIVDVVYNHLGPGDLDLWQFDGWSENDKGGIYFYNDWRSRTPWGETRPDYGRPEVREMICENALMWIRDYGVDGLRWDMTAFIRNVDGSDGDPGTDLADGWSLMQWVNEEIKKANPNAFTIAEDLQGNPFLTKSQKDGGAGFDAQWAAAFVNPIRQALTAPEDSHRDMDKVRDAILHRYFLDAFERVIYTESHDEVANGKARVPEEVDPGKASSWAARKKSTLGAALVFTVQGIPMLFQGQEFLEDDWFHDQDPLDWGKKERFAGILNLYKDLIALRLNRSGVTRGLTGQEVSVYHVDPENKVIAWHRWAAGGPGDSVVVMANFSSQPRMDYRIGFPEAGYWQTRFNSDSKFYDPEFGDVGVSGAEARAPDDGSDQSAPSAIIHLAAYSVLVFSRES